MFSVRRSKIHGRGCFANKEIRPGTVFLVPSYEYSEDTECPYTVWVDDVGYRFYHPFMFLNHHAKPNCELYFEEDGFRLYVLRQIEPGEELTIHYGDNW